MVNILAISQTLLPSSLPRRTHLLQMHFFKQQLWSGGSLEWVKFRVNVCCWHRHGHIKDSIPQVQRHGPNPSVEKMSIIVFSSQILTACWLLPYRDYSHEISYRPPYPAVYHKPWLLVQPYAMMLPLLGAVVFPSESSPPES